MKSSNFFFHFVTFSTINHKWFNSLHKHSHFLSRPTFFDDAKNIIQLIYKISPRNFKWPKFAHFKILIFDIPLMWTLKFISNWKQYTNNVCKIERLLHFVLTLLYFVWKKNLLAHAWIFPLRGEHLLDTH